MDYCAERGALPMGLVTYHDYSHQLREAETHVVTDMQRINSRFFALVLMNKVNSVDTPLATMSRVKPLSLNTMDNCKIKR